MLNKYSMKMVGIKSAAGAMKEDLTYDRFGAHYDLMYNALNGDVWVDYMVGNTWSVYGEGIWRVTSTKQSMTMQDIADAIHECKVQREWYAKEFGG